MCLYVLSFASTDTNQRIKELSCVSECLAEVPKRANKTELEETREFMNYDVLFLRASPDKMLSRDSFFTRAFCF